MSSRVPHRTPCKSQVQLVPRRPRLSWDVPTCPTQDSLQVPGPTGPYTSQVVLGCPHLSYTQHPCKSQVQLVPRRPRMFWDVPTCPIQHPLDMTVSKGKEKTMSATSPNKGFVHTGFSGEGETFGGPMNWLLVFLGACPWETRCMLIGDR